MPPISIPLASLQPNLKVRESKFICKAQGQFGMLQHMTEIQVLNLILGGVNLGVTVLEVGFDHES